MLGILAILNVKLFYILKPNEIIISVTNRCENDLNVSFVPLNECFDNKETPNESLSVQNLSGFIPTAKIEFKNVTENTIINIDKQDSSKAPAGSLKPADLSTNGFVCFRRDNKIGVVCQVTPICVKSETQIEPTHVRVVFGLKHFANSQASETTTPGIGADAASSVIFQKIYIDFGPLRIEDGLKVIPRPKYIDDCLNNPTAPSPTVSAN